MAFALSNAAKRRACWYRRFRYREIKTAKTTTIGAAANGVYRESMRDLLAVRAEEINQFLKGLLGGVEELAVPEGIRAEIALLSENYGLISATLALLNDGSIQRSDDDISGLTNNLRQLSRIAGVQINDIIMACVRYRRESVRPTLH